MSSKFGQIQPLVPMVTDRVMMGKMVSPLFMPPTLKKWGAYCFRLVRQSVRPFVRSSVGPSVQKKFKARVLKFHIWIPHKKNSLPVFFFNVPIISPCRVMPLRRAKRANL